MISLKKNLPRYLLSLIFIILIGVLFGRRILRVEHLQQPSAVASGVVTVVYDGDTIKVKLANGQSRKVRLIGVDAPELNHTRATERFKAFMAKRFTFSHLYKRRVKLFFDREIEDRYGRLLAYVWTEKVGLFNLYIIKEGFASVLLYFPYREDYKQEFLEAEKEAKLKGKGFWQKIPYPRIRASEAADYQGRVVTVVFTCQQVISDKKLLFMVNSSGRFSAVIPEKYISDFPSLENFQGKVVAVTGFLEKYKRQFQIFVFLPSQVKVEN